MRADALVMVYETAMRFRAEIVAGALRANGIRAVVHSKEFEQTAYAGIGGFRVMVRSEDASDARSFIEETERQDAG